jgi:glycosyltransferase involved in cell wall biosynthesis
MRPAPVGYLASHYPAVSHSFVMREVEALRELGVDVETLSIWRSGPDDLLTEQDCEAARTTFTVLPASTVALLRTHARRLIRHPWRYVSTLMRAIRMSPPGAKGHLWQLFYFAEAMMVADHCARTGIRHLHAQFADSATDVALLVSHYGGRDRSWSVALHGPAEFHDVSRRRLATKVADARFVQTISNFGRSQVLALVDEEHWQKVHVIRCGVDPAVYRPRDIPPTTGKPPRILCVGRLVHHKGQSLLVRATAELARRGVDATVTLIGDGPNRPHLEELTERLGVADRVTLLGSVGQDQIRDHYEAADIFCLPSFAEGLPVVLMEAMALERPVIATRIMGVPELVEDGVTGVLVPPADLDALVSAIEALASDPSRRHRLGRAARVKVLDEFDVHRSARRLRELFRDGSATAPEPGRNGGANVPDARPEPSPRVPAG